MLGEDELDKLDHDGCPYLLRLAVAHLPQPVDGQLREMLRLHMCVRKHPSPDTQRRDLLVVFRMWGMALAMALSVSVGPQYGSIPQEVGGWHRLAVQCQQKLPQKWCELGACGVLVTEASVISPWPSHGRR